MKKYIRNIARRIPGLLWFYRLLRRWKLLDEFKSEFIQFKKLSASSDRGFLFNWQDRIPCLGDRTTKTHYPTDYVYHTAWAARVLAEIKPERHVDISSYLYFGTIVSAFVPVEFYDYRPAELVLDNYKSGSVDLLHLPFPERSIQSLSCMHVVEHIGLGRYGDPLDPNGDLKAIGELKRVLANDGNLLFVVPIGRPRIEFNAHRIYSYDMVMKQFADFTLIEFALVPDPPAEGGIIRHASREDAARQDLGCGCFWFRR
jgi:SAM-dependent methyltransferase